MSRQIINIGSAANDGTGDPLRTCFTKSNANFQELYSRYQTTAPTTSKGANGDIAGMYATDATYFYYCIGAWDGSTNIWFRVTGSSF